MAGGQAGRLRVSSSRGAGNGESVRACLQFCAGAAAAAAAPFVDLGMKFKSLCLGIYLQAPPRFRRLPCPGAGRRGGGGGRKAEEPAPRLRHPGMVRRARLGSRHVTRSGYSLSSAPAPPLSPPMASRRQRTARLPGCASA